MEGCTVYEDLSRRQQAILDYIKRQTRTCGYPPSVREIGDAVGLRSSSTVHGHLAQLERKGYIRRDPTKPRAIEVLDQASRAYRSTELVDVPLLGRITAGEPILAVESIEDVYPLPLDLVRSHEAFMLSVRGDSMVNAGIFDGDLVVVRPQAMARDGDIVAARLGEEATVKRFYREKDGIRLQPENPAFQPIMSRDVEILGKVVALFRRIS